MRFVFKTSYEQDINLAKHGGHKLWYGLLMAILLAAPLVLKHYGLDYFLTQLIFILIYSLIGLGLMLLSGFTGQYSLGHAAFLAVGAYTEAYLMSKGLPFGVTVVAAVLLSGAVGVIVGLPALRLSGIYLAIATIAFGFIVEEVAARWESVTKGNEGMLVPGLKIFDVSFSDSRYFYYLCLFFVVLATLAVLNLLRSPTGRAFVAIRDSEVSARSLGINLARYKTTSFAISAALTGLAGVLYAHKIQYLSPEQFGLAQSIEFLMIIIIGGLGSIHGVFLGAIFLIVLPELLGLMKHVLPAAMAEQGGLKPTFFGLILVLFIIFEPLGLYGRWLKVRTFFETFPLYKKATFKRQKTYMKSDRLR